MRAAYTSIYQDIKRAIEQGTYRFGGFLPPESVLVTRYGCAHNTVRKALEILAREAYVQPIHGKGVRVIYRPDPPFFYPSPTSIWHAERRQPTAEGHNDLSCTTRVISMTNIVADEDFATSTGFNKGAHLLKIERVRSYKGRTLEREHNYYRADIVRGITKEDVENSVYEYAERVVGARMVTFKRTVYLERADEQDHALLEMGDADYVAQLLCAAYDNNGDLCEVTSSRQHPDLFGMLQVVRHTHLS